jgi:predicted ATPase/transcriptional regulator with XRE-family HTH domain
MRETLSFGQWLRQHRKHLDLTQEELAQRIGCSYIAIRKMEAGERRPSRQLAYLLADHFKVPAGELEAFVRFARGGSEAAGSASAEQAQPPSHGAMAERPGTGTLPVQLTRLIGREQVAAEIGSYLSQDDVRLLTLTGPPGIGKTSLSIQVASGLGAAFQNGVYFVALAPVVEPPMVTAAIARALGVVDTGQQPLGQHLSKLLHDRRTLLVLDNFEQVVEAAPAVVELLGSCPYLKVLVTSREALRVSGERQFLVPALETADLHDLPSLETLQNVASIALFAERARAVQPGFALTRQNASAVAAICARLQGVPLAIELAAARVSLLSPQEIESRLDTSLSLLGGGARYLPARQRTLRGAIDWSYGLLSEDEQKLFARLGVFAGGCTLAAAEAVCNARGDLAREVVDGIASLIDKSLLIRGEGVGGESRFALLEMIREYALERLALEEKSDYVAGFPADEAHDAPGWGAEIMKRQHAEYFLALAQGGETQLMGSQQVDWLYRLEEEHDNLRAALRWALERREIELALGLAGASWKFWELHGHLSEGRRWLAGALSIPESGRKTKSMMASRAKALFAAGRLAERQGDNSSAQPLLEESLAIARQIDDKPVIAHALHNLSNLATYRGAYAAGRTLAEEGLAIRIELGDKWGMANTLHNLGFQAEAMGDYAAAREFFERSLAISRELGDNWGIAYSLDGVGLLVLEQGDYALANSLIEEGLALRRELGDKSGIARSLERLARAAGRDGRPGRAARLYGAAEALRDKEDIPMMPVDRPVHEQAVAEARSRAGKAEWSKAWQEGREMTVEQAIDFALERSDVLTV